jgi:uncharacterized protein (DUF488 family)
VRVFTIGFTKTTAEAFFTRLQTAGVKKVIDVRLNNVSQLAGFAKRDDLRFFLKAISGIEYAQQTEFAPTQNMLDEYKKQGGAWTDYEKRFLDLIEKRQIEKAVSPEALDGACLLCSEDKPHHCHRRLVAEYLKQKWGNLEIRHL